MNRMLQCIRYYNAFFFFIFTFCIPCYHLCSIFSSTCTYMTIFFTMALSCSVTEGMRNTSALLTYLTYCLLVKYIWIFLLFFFFTLCQTILYLLAYMHTHTHTQALPRYHSSFTLILPYAIARQWWTNLFLLLVTRTTTLRRDGRKWRDI